MSGPTPPEGSQWYHHKLARCPAVGLDGASHEGEDGLGRAPEEGGERAKAAPGAEDPEELARAQKKVRRTLLLNVFSCVCEGVEEDDDNAPMLDIVETFTYEAFLDDKELRKEMRESYPDDFKTVVRAAIIAYKA
jgi:hypothetical protein